MTRVSRGYEVDIKCPRRKPVVYSNVKCERTVMV